MTGTATESRSMQYRADVDGLRAVAVLMVLLFHCQFAAFSGGFIGVDVFFVISGFLITSLLLADLRQGTFSFIRFYGRRIRRLLPALLVTVLLTLIVAVVVMAPEHLTDTAKSGALATLSLSNFYFSRIASYFDVSAQSKPFLHMWSLSLEEQFYLFWPAILLVLHRRTRNWVIPVLIVAGIPVGMAISQYWIGRNPNQAYFLLPFRGFQFLMGAACIWLPRIQIRNQVLGQVIWASGLAVILICAVTFSEATPFPGVAAALPSLGAMLVIWQGQGPLAERLLGNRLMVWFGRISYSTYLVHWPIVVFWLYLSINPLSVGEKVVLALLSVVAGQLLDSQVAQRFRYTRPGQVSAWRFPAVQLGLMALVGVFCAAAVATGGLPTRFALVPTVSQYRNDSVFPFLRDYGDGVLHIAGSGAGRVLIFGDSMAQNYVPAILQLDGIRNAEIDIVSRGGCVLAMDAVLVNFGSPDRECLKLRDHLYQIASQYDLVIWSQNWLGYGGSLYWQTGGEERTAAFAAGAPTFDGWRDGIARTLGHFQALSKRIVVIGPPVTVGNVSPVIARIGPVTDISAVSAQLGLMREVSTDAQESIATGIRGLVTARSSTQYIDPRSIICGDRKCHLSNGKVSYYFDSLHNTSAATPALRSGLERAGLRLRSD